MTPKEVPRNIKPVSLSSFVGYRKVAYHVANSINAKICEVAYDTVGMVTDRGTMYAQARLATNPKSIEDIMDIETAIRLNAYSVKHDAAMRPIMFWRKFISDDEQREMRMLQKQHRRRLPVFMHMAATVQQDLQRMTLVEFTLICTDYLQDMKQLSPVRIAAVTDSKIAQVSHVVKGMSTIVWYQFILDRHHLDQQRLYHFSFGTNIYAFTVDQEATMGEVIALSSLVFENQLRPAESAAMRKGNEPFAHNEKFSWFDVACDDYETLFQLKKFLLNRISGSVITTNIKKRRGTLFRNSRRGRI